MGSKQRVTIDNLADAIQGILQDYANDVEDAMEPVLKKSTQTARAELRRNSPKNTGSYSKGWQYKREKTRHGVKFTIYNGTKPGLTHLLEHGHLKRDGSRTPAHPHIAEIEKKVVDQLPREVMEALDDIR